MYACFLSYLAIIRPYSSNFHNIGAITNALLVTYFLAWSGLKSYELISQSEDNELFALFLFLLLSIASVLSSLARIVHEVLRVAAVLCKRWQEKNKNAHNTLIQR